MYKAMKKDTADEPKYTFNSGTFATLVVRALYAVKYMALPDAVKQQPYSKLDSFSQAVAAHMQAHGVMGLVYQGRDPISRWRLLLRCHDIAALRAELTFAPGGPLPPGNP